MSDKERQKLLNRAASPDPLVVDWLVADPDRIVDVAVALGVEEERVSWARATPFARRDLNRVAARLRAATARIRGG